MTDTCHYALERIEPQLRLNSDLPSLQAPEDRYQGQTYAKGFMNAVFMRGDHPFSFHSHPATDGNVCSGQDKMYTGRMINGGLFSLRMSPGLDSKSIVGVF
ncbi:hypothetical protein TNCV_2539591 [Trichonephila clavipes]|nr:hypothetical protein TNCV_2539591 [Trichonephila clavipes]